MKTSRNDHRDYRSIKLKNGLNVLLIQDPYTDKAAASLCVNVGHFDDPDSRQGMAHFLEHMLFLGTRSYPQHSAFSDFMNVHGGNANAWTGTEHSCFYFDIEPDYFAEGLKRFGEFFHSPLLSNALTANERNAIDAEFKLKLKDDGRRIYQVHKETVNPLHPFSKFSVGNKDTLADRETCIRDELASFFEHHYHGDNMTLCVCAQAELDTLAGWVKTAFNAVKVGTGKKPPIHEPLYRPQDLGKLIQITPHKHLQKCVIAFALPNVQHYYTTKSVGFLAHLLGYEGQGSLYALLKEKGWINALSAGGGIDGSNFKDFNVSIALTDEGVAVYQAIVEAVFAYLALIKQNLTKLEALYQDKQRLLDIAFDNQERGRTLDWVNGLSVNMQHYPEEDFIMGDFLMTHYAPQELQELLAYFSPMNMRVTLISVDADVDQTTHWYHTPYSVRPLSLNWLRSLADIDAPQEGMALPLPNPYLQNEVVLHPNETLRRTPECLSQVPGYAFWYLQDHTFNVAKGHIYLAIDSPLAVESTQAMAMTRLFADLFMDCAAEPFYPAELAGLTYHLASHQGGLTLHTSGLSASQMDLLDHLLDYLLAPNISAKRFAEYKKQLLRHWQQYNHNKPVNQLFSELSAALMPWNPAPKELARALEDVSFHQFQNFIANLFTQVHVRSFMYGNWRRVDANSCDTHIQARFAARILDKPSVRPLNLLTRAHTQTCELNHDDHAMVIYYQAEQNTVAHKIRFMMLNHVLSQPYFNALRTEQQLGYLVGCGYAPFNYHPGMTLYIQSPNVSATKLVNLSDAFCQQFTSALSKMPEQTWVHLRNGLASQIQERDKNMRLRSQRLWLSISQDDTEFNAQTHLLSELASLTLADVQHFASELFTSSTPRAVFLAQPLVKKKTNDTNKLTKSA